MESLQLQIPNASMIFPSDITQKSAPNTPPRRHIHSSFPYYFYSTPPSPSSDGLAAFVASCESRLSNFASPTSKSDAEELRFPLNKSSPFSNAQQSECHKLYNKSLSFKCTPISLTTADELFHNGKLLPTKPLKLPPRLQQIENIRKSLRGTQSFNYGQAYNNKTSDIFDPFVAAVETIRKQDVPWCQVSSSSNHRKVKSFEHSWLDVDPIWDGSGDTDDVAKKVVGKEETEWKKLRKRNTILRYLKGSMKVNQKESCEHESTSSSSLTKTNSKSSTASNESKVCKKVRKRTKILKYVKLMTQNVEEKRENEAVGNKTLVQYKKYHDHNPTTTLFACLRR